MSVPGFAERLNSPLKLADVVMVGGRRGQLGSARESVGHWSLITSYTVRFPSHMPFSQCKIATTALAETNHDIHHRIKRFDNVSLPL
jgi:hypothetical protein